MGCSTVEGQNEILSKNGILFSLTDDHNILSRTSEVLQCLQVLNEGCDGETTILLFLTHTFEEVGFTSKPLVIFYFLKIYILYLLILEHGSNIVCFLEKWLPFIRYSL